MTQTQHSIEGFGLGLRGEHIAHILSTQPDVDWFEIVTENFMHHRGRFFDDLLRVRKDYPVVTHGVSLSIGSTDPLDHDYIKQMKQFIDIIEPSMVSDHLCWTHVNGRQSYDLLPLPYHTDVVQHVVERVDAIQSLLQRQILLENVSSYIGHPESDMQEWEFMKAVSDASGCGLLLDINNIYVNAYNFAFDGRTFIEGVPTEAIGYLHFGGHEHMGDHLFDTHGAPMVDGAWQLYEHFLHTHGSKPSVFEWDTDIPAFDVLMQERAKAMEIQQRVLA